MYPVVIVGGGPVGLVASCLLSTYGVPHAVYERHAGTSVHPKAIGVNQRTMEVFRRIGLEKELYKHCAPSHEVATTAWYTSLGPQSQSLYIRNTNAGGIHEPDYRRASPTSYCILPQIRLEPLILKRALELNPDGIFTRTEVVALQEEAEFVQITVKNLDSMEITTVTTQFIIGADGGRTVGPSAGIKYEGKANLVDMVTAHIRAPISLFEKERSNLITWFINPKLGGSIGTGYMYCIGPFPAHPDDEEFVFACARKPEEPTVFDEHFLVERIRATLEIPDIPIKVLSLSHWYINSIVAERYQSKVGRMFLVGDAAHRIPPWGALGMNTGIQDVYNLIWKLVFATKIKQHRDCSKLLSTYASERHEIGRRVARTSLHNFEAHAGLMDTALGISPEASAQENQEAIAKYLDNTNPEGDGQRTAVEKAQSVLDMEFRALGADVGWFYPAPDVNGDAYTAHHASQFNKDGEFDSITYYPSTIPGHHFPHAWLERRNVITSSIDLVPMDRYLLVTSVVGLWEDAQSDLLNVEIIDGKTSWRDIEGRWAEVRGVNADGAVLVRPDGIVVWRTHSRTDLGSQNLRDYISKLLDHTLGLEEADTVDI
ncbi:uncharacterized protein A1O9_12228 [Exophiala aquamarina CBS 119918]|uniref:FAD-binding domain-containing protein n=1 Tax=Exophiala aquamarina CBS 119918 TaxID=1182545 RepID=A0A072NX31_9EURO|nr:uncharacterized protein A1O9_12228 [Exophiala aquamarina CBS 119918]KEF51593.1 hypothetical protein A1O9_12228 [Exophiala aquamarina CBS 119918]